MRQVWPYLFAFPPHPPADFDPYRRGRWPNLQGHTWVMQPVGAFRKYNGAHGRNCCGGSYGYKQKGWRRRRSVWLERNG